ncbi:hypothetical protein [Gordonia paraffinivorans]|nr:hypothetical protein [Gordonia paraffinivorans]
MTTQGRIKRAAALTDATATHFDSAADHGQWARAALDRATLTA